MKPTRIGNRKKQGTNWILKSFSDSTGQLSMRMEKKWFG